MSRPTAVADGRARQWLNVLGAHSPRGYFLNSKRKTDVKPGDVAHAVRLAREVTAVLGAGLLPREAQQPMRRSR